MIERRRSRLVPLLRAALAGCCAAGIAAPAPAAEWEYFGTNTLRFESYNTQGNPLASPYPVEGTKGYQEFGVNMQKRESEYDLWRAQIYGVLNGSNYRSPFDGIVPERLSLSREKGDAAIPHRWELGDYFGYFSYRTLQRSLKGGMLELQPRVDPGVWEPSIILLTGTQEPDWRNVTPQEDYTNGLSMMLRAPGGRTRLIGNFIRNHRGSDFLTGTLARAQDVYSLGAEHVTRWGTQLLTFEGEAGGMVGDHDGLAGPASGQNRDGTAFYGQVMGRSLNLPLSYRFRAERTEQDYRPNGAVITPDREAVEAHAQWLFPAGLSLRGRVQLFTDGYQTVNPIDTKTIGASVSGVFFPRHFNGMIGTLDAFRQDIESRNHAIDRRINTVNFNITKPLIDGWVGRAGAFYQTLSDSAPGAVGFKTYQLSLGADHFFQVGGWIGTVTPGVTLRYVDGGPGQTNDINPTLAFYLLQGPHRIGFNYGLLAQEPVPAAAPSVYTTQVAADYRYTKGQHTFGFELNVFDRDPVPGAYTGASRASVFWSYSFEKTRLAARAPLVSDAVGVGAALPRSPALLLALAPGGKLDEQLKRLDDIGIRGVRQPGVAVFETRLLDEIDQRQRLAVAHDGDTITRSALIVDLEAVGGAETAGQLFERVRRALLDRFGRPITSLEEGVFGPTLSADLASGRFIRVMEWPTEAGRLRLGIPRRLDGVVRIEVQHAKSFPGLRDPVWSMETVR